jgi:TonB family protein
MRSFIMILVFLPFSFYAQNSKHGTITVRKNRANPIAAYVSDSTSYSAIQFIATDIRYPQAAIDSGIQGTVYVQLTVNEDGTLTDLKVLKGIPRCPECDQEALRVINLTPLTRSGTPAKVEVVIPVRFKLQ